MTNTNTVPDLATEQQILVARVIASTVYTRERYLVRKILSDLGIKDLLPDGPARVAVDVSSLVQSLPSIIEVSVVTDSERAASDVRRATTETLVSRIERHFAALDDASIVAEPLPARKVDVDAVIQRWGGPDADYPAAGSEEIEAFRRLVVMTAIDRAGLSPYLRDALRAVGLHDYLPST